jgi:predicted DNA-binding transcriptional regulator AlpA
MQKLLTTQQLAEFLNLSPVTLKIWRSHGKGPRWQRVGAKSVRYALEDVEAWMAQSAKHARASSTLRTTA